MNATIRIPIAGCAWLATAALTLSLCAPSLLAQVESFDDGNDANWTRIDPLAGVGAGGTGTWSFPNGAYRIQAAASQAPGTVGPGRAGSMLTDVTLSRFYAAVDIVAWDNSLDQIFGLLARLRNVGLGTTEGYGFTYATRTGRAASGQLEIFRVTNEAGSDLTGATLNFTLQPGASYRLVFAGDGASFTGTVFSVTNLAAPLATVRGTDSSYAVGGVGLFTYDNSPAKNHSADVTFDNFLAAPAAPPRLIITANYLGEAAVSWPVEAAGYVLQASPNLANGSWSDITTGIAQSEGQFIYLPTFEDQRFFRLRWP
ncbi:MAG: hypothetical protein HZA90_14880 [Verrucomicrobia bacterium]|nr:hypothetical protein [Verrucomicrobiota bacterium]